MVEIFATFAVVVVIMVAVAAVGIEMPHVAFAQRHSGVDDLEIFVVFFFHATACGRFVVVRRPGRTLFAARTTFGVALARAAATAATTTSAARAIFTITARLARVSFGGRSLVGEISDFAIHDFIALLVDRSFVAASRFGPGIAREITSVLAARRSFAAAASITIAASPTSTATIATAAFAVTAAAAVTVLVAKLAAAGSRTGVDLAAELIGAFAVDAVDRLAAVAHFVELARRRRWAAVVALIVASSSSATSASTSAARTAVAVFTVTAARRAARLVAAERARIDITRVDVARVDLIVS